MVKKILPLQVFIIKRRASPLRVVEYGDVVEMFLCNRNEMLHSGCDLFKM